LTISMNNPTKTWRIFARLSIAFLCLIAFPIISEASTSTTTASIDFNKLPMPGQDAFWAHNPKNPTQKILLVPSMHELNLRKLANADLFKAMKNGDILITESHTKAESWQDGEKFFNALRAPITELKAKGIIRDHPFEINGISWTKYVKHLDPASFEYLNNEIQPFLQKIPLSNIHPDFVVFVLTIVAKAKGKSFLGMDNQIVRNFNLKNKTVLELETDKELQALGLQKDAIDLAARLAAFHLDMQGFASTFNNLKLFINNILSLSDEAPNASYASALNEIEKIRGFWIKSPGKEFHPGIEPRNNLWLPKLLNAFDQNHDKFIVVVVGAAHFPTSIGILHLLSEKGFTFTRFGEGAPAAVAEVHPVKGVEPQTEVQKKISEAEKGKAVTAASQAIPARDEALLKRVVEIVDYSLENKMLPQIIETGKPPRDASSIKQELKNALATIPLATLGTGLIKGKNFLKAYIQTRNDIYAEASIGDKIKALEILERNPQFDINKVKAALHGFVA
jgi:DNA-binding phage protein